MSEETVNSATAVATSESEDGGAATSPPQSQAEATTESVSPGEGSEGQRAPAQTKPDPEDEAYDRLLAASESRTTETPASPSTSETKPQSDPFASLERSSFEALKRTNLLPSGEEWKAMPSLARARLVAGAKSILAANERLFQASRKQAGPSAGTGIIPPPGGAQQQPGAGGTTPPSAAGVSGTQAYTAAQSPVVMPQATGDPYQMLADRYEPELAQMVGSIINMERDRHQQDVGQLNQALQQLAVENEFLIRRLEQSEEQSAFKALDEEFAQIPEYKNGREAILQKASALLGAEWQNGNRGYTYEQAIQDAVRSQFSQKLQQQAQLKLANQRKASLRGTPERGTAVAQSRPSTPGDIEDEVYERLAAAAARRVPA